MCLIAVAPIGVEKNSEFFLNALKESAKINNDGFGFAVRYGESNSVSYQKGFKNISDLIDKVKLFPKSAEVVVHLRMRSAGRISVENCHPFEINHFSDYDVMNKGDYFSTTVRPLLFHNGTFPEFVHKDDERSDTYRFVENFLRVPDIFELLVNNREKFMEAFKSIIRTNRLVIMGRELKESIFIGDFITTKEGYVFSNRSFERYGQLPSQASKQKQEVEENSKGIVKLNTLERETYYNAGLVRLSELNYKDFYYKAHCNSHIQAHVLKDEVYEIKGKSVEGNDYMLQKVSSKGSYIYLSPTIIETIFLKTPKSGQQVHYTDYFRLKSLINPVSSTAVKKIYNKVTIAERNRGKINADTGITLKYVSTERAYTFKSTLLFLLDNTTDFEYAAIKKLYMKYCIPEATISEASKLLISGYQHSERYIN